MPDRQLGIVSAARAGYHRNRGATAAQPSRRINPLEHCMTATPSSHSHGAHRVRTIDIHAHWYPPEWLKLFEQDGAKEGASLERSGARYTVRTDRIVNAFDEEFVDLDLRLAGMDR
jgi:hypothetical protein